jgi:hypothetical protein
MNRSHLKAPSVLVLGWLADVMSRLEQAFEPAPRALSPRAVAARALESPFPVGPRVLVVDDNPSNLGDACEALESWGIVPMLAADGAEAVALAAVHDFDLILMDLQMPVLDGLAATRQIRTHEQEHARPRAPVLAYTSRAVEARLLRLCGLDGVLDKPCSAQALQQCLLRWCAAGSGFDFEPLVPACLRGAAQVDLR